VWIWRRLPVVVTDVGGPTDAARADSGTVFVHPRNPQELADGIVVGIRLSGVRHHTTYSWDDTLEMLSFVIDGLLLPTSDGKRHELRR